MEEWERRFLPEVELTASDQELREQLAEGGNDARLVVEELKNGLRVRATSWVGVVRFEKLELRIVPKLVGGNLGILRMINYASGLGSLKRLPRAFNLSTGEPNLIDLVCSLLADQAEQVIAAGLLQGYIPREDALPVLRGRFLPFEQARRRYMVLDKVECRFEEFETDIVENQLVAAGLARARSVCFDSDIQRRVRYQHSVWTEACDPMRLDWSAVESLEPDRRNAYYRSAHLWSRLLLERTALRDVFDSGEGRSFAFLLNMNRLFEDFVSRLVKDSFLNRDFVSVSAQHRDSSIIENERTGQPYSAVIPDLLVELASVGGVRRMPIDAKYKKYDDKKLEPADVYQTFMYSYAFGREGQTPIALLIYPSDKDSEGTSLRIRVGDSSRVSRISAMSLNVPHVLDQIAGGQSGLATAALRERLLQEWRLPDGWGMRPQM